MLTLIALTVLGQTPAPPAAAKLSFSEGRFSVEAAGRKESVPIQSTEKKPSKVYMYQDGQRWLVWDGRGLTIRIGSKASSTQLPEYPVSPKLFEKSEIEQTLVALQKGQRRKGASGLSGVVQDGKTLYLLVRWDEKSSGVRPWFEALVKVDMSQEQPKPQLLGRWKGVSRARGEFVGQELRLLGRDLLAVTESAAEWNVSRFSLQSQQFTSQSIGRQLEAVAFQIGAQRMLFIERTSYGTRLGGVLRLNSMARRNLLESRDPFRFLPGPSLIAVINSGENRIVRSIESGSELTLPAQVGMASIQSGLLVWTPPERPQRAVLYDARRWVSLARWERSPQPAPAAPTGRSVAPPTSPGTRAGRPPRS